MGEKMQFTELKLQVSWGHIAAKAYGSPTGTRVLMAHGTFDNAASFDRLIPLLKGNYYFVSVDLPGHGFSSHFPSTMPVLDIFTYVYVIQLILDVLEWESCIYIGHSLGGILGTMFSMLYPERIQKLVAIDSFVMTLFSLNNHHSLLKSAYDSVAKQASSMSKLYTKEEVLYALKCKRKAALNSEAANALFSRAVTKIDNLYKYNRDIRVGFLLKPPVTTELYLKYVKKVVVPTLVIVADSSVASIMMTRKVMATFFEDGNVQSTDNITVIIVNGNHDVHNNNPEKVAPHICKFLNNTIESKL